MATVPNAISDQDRNYTKTVRLDFKTRVCLMAALLSEGNDRDAVERALQIDTFADAAIKRLKRSNPIPHASQIR